MDVSGYEVDLKNRAEREGGKIKGRRILEMYSDPFWIGVYIYI